MQKRVHFILTGGTIDSYYYPPQETSVPHEQSIIPDYIDTKIKPYTQYSYETICMLDSGDITDEIREKIFRAVVNAATRHVIITHGTNTMAETAKYIKKRMMELEAYDMSVILTGAMIPLKEFAMSDAGFNLGYAVAQAENAPTGVYIAMNGRLFSANQVKKNTDIGRFEAR